MPQIIYVLNNTVSLTVFILLFMLHLTSNIKSHPNTEILAQYIKT